ncbi:hypothetical protein POMI540_0167 [Schizosaccharomyces pombe]
MAFNGYGIFDSDPRKNPSSDLRTQFWLAFLLGASACVFFCFFRKRWKVLYAPRTTIEGLNLPTLSSSYYKWLMDLVNIPDDVVQNCAGLDGYVFLLFFKMGIKFLSFTSLLGVLIIMPVNKHFRGDAFGNITLSMPAKSEYFFSSPLVKKSIVQSPIIANGSELNVGVLGPSLFNPIGNLSDIPGLPQPGDGFLYLYVLFTYFISIFLLYVLFSSTKSIADIRQSYLARQNRLTDRTVFISGLPNELCSTENLKAYFDKLDVGSIDSLSICRNYSYMDILLSKKSKYVKKLEKYWSIYLSNCKKLGISTLPPSNYLSPNRAELESTPEQLLEVPWQHHQCHPLIKTHFFGIFGQKIDAIDFYSAKLYKISQQIENARSFDYPTTGQAFITFESMATAQIVAQTHIDSKSLMGLHIELAPAANDIQWHNTYIGRWHKFFQGWFITLVTFMIILLWTVPVGAIAVFINLDTIRRLWPELGRMIEDLPFLNSLLRTFLPTLVYSLFISISPFLFRWLSSMQGLSSRAEEEIYAVGKNYAYLFVNFFLVYVIAGSTSIWELAKDTTSFAHFLANRLPHQAQFFIDLIVLQGIGMFPLKLIQLGKLSSYFVRRSFVPYSIASKKFETPDSFSVGIFLPQPMFIMLICLCYSIISPLILVFGLIYFIIGFLVYKYELIYQMEHPQHSTGELWSTIFLRMIFGCVIMQLTMMGLMSLRKAYWLSTVIFPLLCFTVISAYNFSTMIRSSMQFVSLYYIRTHQSNTLSSESESRNSESSGSYVHPGFDLSNEELPLIDLNTA